MNKKIVIPLVTAVAAVVIGFAVFRDRSQYFDPNKPDLIQYLLGFKTPTFQTVGKQLLDPCGNPIILKGVNKLSVFDTADLFGKQYFREIAKSGANCVRIVWEMQSKGVDNPISRLDSLISNAKANKLIPIVGLWDYTDDTIALDGGFSHLNEYIAYWTRPDVAGLIKKHQKYLIVNIANEAAKADGLGGDEDSSAHQIIYAEAYKQAVSAIRKVGVNVPLMIDGMDRGKSLKCFAKVGRGMLNADPLHNLIFSFHPYWPQSITGAPANKTFIASAFAAVDTVPITIVMGELAGFGAGAGEDAVRCSPSGAVDYLQFAKLAYARRMGWLLWEWGPKGIPSCVSMDMTTDGTYLSVTTSPNKWVLDLAINQPFSLKYAQKTPFIVSGFKTCQTP